MLTITRDDLAIKQLEKARRPRKQFYNLKDISVIYDKFDTHTAAQIHSQAMKQANKQGWFAIVVRMGEFLNLIRLK